MLRGGLGSTGDQHSKDCTFQAGEVAGAPLVVSWYIVIFTAYQIIDAVKHFDASQYWYPLALIVGRQLVLYSSVLVHELGHGSMAKWLGGNIVKILLWPFGGICFSTHPQTDNARTALKNCFKIVVAGPTTHFPQTFVWMVVLLAFERQNQVERDETSPTWRLLLPFSSPYCHRLDGHLIWKGHCDGIFGSGEVLQLLYSWLLWGVQINVLSFFFNVFFPMYPMDCAQMLVCGVQLFCNVSAHTAAVVLLCCSIPCAVFFIGYTLYNVVFLQNGGFLGIIPAYIGVMSLADALKIWRLRNERRLHTHPLFMQARSQTRDVFDGYGVTRQLNTDDRDDEPGQELRSAGRSSERHAPLQLFAGTGHTLSGSAVNADPETGRKKDVDDEKE